MARHFKAKKLKPAIAVIGEGITEQIYFAQLRQYERLDFALKPSHPKNSSIKEIVKKANDLLKKEFDWVFCVFDMDKISRNRTIRKEYNTLRRESQGKNIQFIENDPCIEFWFLLHFQRTTREFNTCEQLETLLKQHIPDYEKTKKYLIAKNIYAHLKPRQDNACKNAAYTVEHSTPASSKSEIYLILDYLNIKTNAHE